MIVRVKATPHFTYAGCDQKHYKSSVYLSTHMVVVQILWVLLKRNGSLWKVPAWRGGTE